MNITNKEGQEVTYERLTLSNKSQIPLSKDDNFGVYFANAMEEIATARLSKPSIQLICLLMSHLTRAETKKGDNSVQYLPQKIYAEMIACSQKSISNAIKQLEERGYIMRDKETRSIYITINTKLAYAGRWKDYTPLHNQLALDFGNSMYEIPPTEEEIQKLKGQDWSSDLAGQLEEKRTI